VDVEVEVEVEVEAAEGANGGAADLAAAADASPGNDILTRRLRRLTTWMERATACAI